MFKTHGRRDFIEEDVSVPWRVWPVRSPRWWPRGWHRRTSLRPARLPRPERETEGRTEEEEQEEDKKEGRWWPWFKARHVCVFPSLCSHRALLSTLAYWSRSHRHKRPDGVHSNHGSFKPTQCRRNKQQLWRGNLSLNISIYPLYPSACLSGWKRK